MTYDKGSKYKVVKPGGYLTGWKHLGGSSFGGTRHDLNVGDVIESLGVQYSGGGDGIHCPRFVIGDERGEFNPNSWGSPINGYLEEVTE